MTIRKIVTRIVFFWGLIFGVGVVTFALRTNLELEKYFPKATDYLQFTSIVNFLNDKWHQLILLLLLAWRVLVVTTNSGRLNEFGEKCFVNEAMPANFARVQMGRWIVIGIAINAFILVACLWAVERPALFFALLFVHWILGLSWMLVMRRNITTFFDDDLYVPNEANPLKPPILMRRAALRHFVQNRYNIERYLALAASSFIAAGAWMFSSFGVLGTILYAVIFVIDAVYAWIGRRALKRKMSEADDMEEQIHISREALARKGDNPRSTNDAG